MNVHSPQNIFTVTDLQELMAVKNNIISVQSNQPLIAPIQDGLTGIYLITQENSYVSIATFNDIVTITERFDNYERIKKYCLENGLPLYTGRMIFSILLPHNFYYYKKVDDNIVFIENGILKSGFLNKVTIGDKANSIIHYLCKYYGNDFTINFISNVQYLSNRYLVQRGFSVGLSDCISTSDKVAQNEMNKLTLEAETLEQVQIFDDAELLQREIKVNNLLNNAKNIGQKLSMEELGKDNRLKVMVEAGSKGSYINIAQICGLLGQQNLTGKRPKPVLSNNTRTLPHFNPNDTDPKSRGFVSSSFLKGLDPIEFFFHAMGGREGLVDTAIKTAETGYTQHKIVKVLEDLKVDNDYGVKDNNGKIYQFAYGGNNMDPMKLCYRKGQKTATWLDFEYLANIVNDE